MESILKWGGLVLVALLLGAAIGLLTAFPVMLLWNAVMPGVFGLKAISFSEALMLSLLSSLLFKSSNSSNSK